MILKNKRLILVMLVLIMSAFASITPAWAQGGESSSSPGIPGQKPITLVSVTLEDGSKIDNLKGVSLKPKLTLTFDKNVVNMLYWENNTRCFSLSSENKGNIGINVTKIDDTVDFSQRQKIFLEPVSQLKPATSYYLKISQNLRAKNGVILGKSAPDGITVSFKTEKLSLPQNSKANITTDQKAFQKPAANLAKNSTNTKKTDSEPQKKIISEPASKSDNLTENKVESDTKVLNDKKDALTGQAIAASGTKSDKKNTGGFKDNKNGVIEFLLKNWLAASTILLVALWVAAEIVIKKKLIRKDNFRGETD